MKQPSLFAHIRNIFILPFTVTVVVPYFIYDKPEGGFAAPGFQIVLGLLLISTGLFFLFWTIFLFRTVGKGTLAPWEPTQKLVVRGPYSYCRNPMISGVFFILIGEALVFSSLAILYWAATFFLINTVYFILKEEPDLQKRFGRNYEEYKKQVPRWLPRTKAYTQPD